MDNNLKNFDDLFRDGLADHAEVPPARVWDALEKRLDTVPVGGRSSGSSWYWYAGVATVVALVGSMWWNMSRDRVEVPVATAIVADTKVDNNAPVIAIKEEDAAVADVAAEEHSSPVHRVAPAHKVVNESKPEPRVTPLGNAVAQGTSVHSYDDFDDRSAASARPAAAGVSHTVPGYRINKIKKHGIVAAEMVPAEGRPVPAAHERTVSAPVKDAKSDQQVAATVRRQPARRVATKPLSPVAVQKPAPAKPAAVSVPDPQVTTTSATAAALQQDAKPETTGTVSAPVQDNPADKAAAATTRPAVPSVVSPRPKPAVQPAAVRPSTGGSELTAKTAESDTAKTTGGNSTNLSSGNTNAKKKGLKGLFRKIMKNGSK